MKIMNLDQLRKNNTKTLVRGDIVTSSQIIESCKESYQSKISGSKHQVLAMARNNFPDDVDVSWLVGASETYDISPNINDYVITDVMALTADVPNRNLQGFPYEELTYFDYNYGKFVYNTFVGKPSCLNHANEVDKDTNLAKGVIFASVMQYFPDYDIWKVRILQGWDRTKDAKLANDILNRKRKYYSMGALVSSFIDPITGLISGSVGSTRQPKGSVYMGNLCWDMCLGVVFLENSSVEEPADCTAEGQIF